MNKKWEYITFNEQAALEKNLKVSESLPKFKNFIKCLVNFLSPLSFIFMHLHTSNFHLRTELQKYFWKKNLFLQYLWSDSKKIPEISCENIVLMRFLTNFTVQHNLNSLNLFPNSKPFEIRILPQMPCYIVQKLQVNKGVCHILPELWVRKEVVKPGILSKLSNLSVFFFFKHLHTYVRIYLYICICV